MKGWLHSGAGLSLYLPVQKMLRLLKKSITRKFMILYFIVGVSSLSMIGFYAYYKARNALVMRATEQLNSVKAFKKAQVEFFLQHQIGRASCRERV